MKKCSQNAWNTTKHILSIVCIVLLGATLFSGCAKEPTISADVEAVLKATCNTPNPELHDPDAVIYIGGDQPMTDEEKAAVLRRQEEIDQNWENLLGEYFSPGSFDLFLSSYLRGYFLYDDPVPSELVAMTLVSKDDTQEIVDIQVSVDGAMEELTVTFRRNPDGLLYRVDIAPK